MMVRWPAYSGNKPLVYCEQCVCYGGKLKFWCSRLKTFTVAGPCYCIHYESSGAKRVQEVKKQKPAEKGAPLDFGRREKIKKRKKL